MLNESPSKHGTVPRSYEIADLLDNGEAVLDAADHDQGHHRRWFHTADLPAGAHVGSVVVVWPTGDVTLAHTDKQAKVALDLLEAEPRSPPYIVSMALSAIVQTIADTIGVPPHIAARMCETWLQYEYRLICDE